MASQNVDRIAADPQARPGNQPLIDRIPHRGVSRSRALRAHVALCRKARHQVRLCRLFGENHAPRYRLFNSLQVFSPWMQKEMNMRIDQAGHKSYIAEVENTGSLRMRHRFADFTNMLALDENLAGLDHGPRSHLEQSCRMKDHRNRVGCLLCRDGTVERQRRNKACQRNGATIRCETHKVGHEYDYAASGPACR